MRGLMRGALVTAMLLGLAVGVWGQTPGIGAAAFFRRGVDARALAMGNAHVAVVDGYSATYWNPAGLARAASPQIGGMTADLYGAQIYLNFLAGVYPWQPGGEVQTPSETLVEASAWKLGFGVSFAEMATEVRAFDEQGNPLGLIRYSEALYGLGVGAWIPGLGYAGLAAKGYSFRAPRAGVGGVDATASGFGFDAGLAAPVWGELWLGIAGADIGDSTVQWRDTPLEPRDKVAGRYTAGVAYVADEFLNAEDRLVAALDASFWPLLDLRSLQAGIEYTLGFLSLRGGAVLRERDDAPLSFSAGVGVHVMQLSVDAAWVQNRELPVEGAGHTLVVSASFSF